ncbi:hypothetical protein HBH98_056900 [Parastagonospora nodorum]|nr:hypothetical protein HBH53_132420 [Parastagonospora nodorum]KAH3972923.1 hypothetical protein HBH52_145300 [Parastagonospora nodorum]KAH4004428.1 hypothetical protein HBI10_052260 [Parastagonospora nodorum]KAH4016918.1 hypothetical protein HBI13_145080 [Parastagonospora nodorum]KAH4038402.1 hypothetical protein HBI09_050860 [Parastagonospora nodorum]
MSTAATGSGGNQPPSMTLTSIPPSGDGKSPQTATWSPALSINYSAQKTYVVNGLGLVPHYRRTTLVEARSFAQVYTILDGDTYETVHQLPAGPMINPKMPAATSTTQQVTEIEDQETAISTGTGPAADQYNASQAYHGDALASTDSNGDSDSNSDEASDSDSE